MGQHTPGPWTVDDPGNGRGTYRIVTEEWIEWRDDETGAVEEYREVIATVSDLDNGRLIAAAPDLLAACRAIMAADYREVERLRGPAWDKIKAAIAKATGESR